MSAAAWYSMVGIALFAMGFAALVLHRELLRRVIALNLMGNGVFLLFVATANRAADGPDPVPLAMVLTGLVVSVSATALALALIVRLRQHSGSSQLPEDHST